MAALIPDERCFVFALLIFFLLIKFIRDQCCHLQGDGASLVSVSKRAFCYPSSILFSGIRTRLFRRKTAIEPKSSYKGCLSFFLDDLSRVAKVPPIRTKAKLVERPFKAQRPLQKINFGLRHRNLSSAATDFGLFRPKWWTRRPPFAPKNTETEPRWTLNWRTEPDNRFNTFFCFELCGRLRRNSVISFFVPLTITTTTTTTATTTTTTLLTKTIATTPTTKAGSQEVKKTKQNKKMKVSGGFFVSERPISVQVAETKKLLEQQLQS